MAVVGVYVHRLKWACVLSNHRYYCPEGSQNEKGFNGTSNHPCTTGYYCPIGIGDPKWCPAGTFNNQTRASSINACLDCAPGSASSDGASFCSVCDNGKYESKARCWPCKKGHWCEDGLHYPCPVNMYTALTYTCMHGRVGTIGIRTQWVQDINLNVRNARKVCYPRKVPHKLQTVQPTLTPCTLTLSHSPFSFTHVHAVFELFCIFYARASCL